MPVTITGFTFDFSRSGSTGYLRFYADSDFHDPDGVFHPAQAAGGRDYLKEVALTVASNVATVPSFTLPATWDEASGARSSVTAYILDSNRQKVGVLVSNFRIPLLPNPTTWGYLLTHNDNAATIRDTATYTKQQTDYLIDAALSDLSLGTADNPGRVKLSVAPISAANPVAVGTNDPLVIDAGDYASFAAAVAAIGATPTTLNISTALTVASNVTVPSTLTLRFVGAGQLSVNNGITVTINGFVVGENRRLFAGSGSVVLPSNNCGYDIRPRWFAAGSGTYADPYTEWSTRCTWGGNTYRFTQEFYSYAVSPAFSHPGIKLYGDGAYLIYTGSGAAIDFLSSSRAPGAHTYGAHMENFIVQGLNASHGLYVQTTHQSVFKDIRVRNLPGIAFYFKSSNWDTLDHLISSDPVGDSIIGSQYPAATVVPTTGLYFDDGAVFPGDPTTNNAMTVINITLNYINGIGVKIESLISSTFFGGAVEQCVMEGVVVSPGNVALTNSVSLIGTEVEFNNGSGSDIYINSKSTSLINIQGFNAVVSVDSGAENTLILGGVYDTINILSGSKSTTLLNVHHNYSGSGGISNGGTKTTAKNVIDKTTGDYYPDAEFLIPNTPAQLTANANNWNPGRNSLVRASSDASRNVTGISNLQEDGMSMQIWNVGSNDIVLVNESASSTAANRFTTSTGADLTLATKKCAILMYDGSSQRWRAALLP